MTNRTAGTDFLLRTFTADEIRAAAANLKIKGAGVGVHAPWAEAAAICDLISFGDSELVALDGNSAAVVVWAHGRLQSSISRLKTATSDNITFQCLFQRLMDDEVIPQWGDRSSVECLPSCS